MNKDKVNVMKKEYEQEMFPDLGRIVESDIDKEKAEKLRRREAYERAHDIRKFEIELYWKRAAYFWAFEAVALAGFGVLFLASPTPSSKDQIALAMMVLALGGGIITGLWRCVLSGSKFWQENWENHIDMLESEFSGNLYKVVFQRKNKPNPFSVSKASSGIAWTFLGFWFLALILSLLTFFDDKCSWVRAAIVGIDVIVVLVVIIAIIAIAIWGVWAILLQIWKSSFLRSEFDKTTPQRLIIRQPPASIWLNSTCPKNTKTSQD